jgi:hypothetical protein
MLIDILYLSIFSNYRLLFHISGHGEVWKSLQIRWRLICSCVQKWRLILAKAKIKECLTLENFQQVALLAAKTIVNNVILRALSSFIFSSLIILSILSWQNAIPWTVSLPVAGGLGILVSIFYTISVTFRCVLILSIPQFTTQQGRFVVLFVVSALLLGGPLVSITYNTNQAAYSLSCMANMTAKQGKALTDSYRKAYVDMAETVNKTYIKLQKAKASTDERILKTLEDVHKAVETVRKSILDELSRCSSVMNSARTDCLSRSSIAFNNCLDVTKGLRLHFLCELVKIAPGICDKGLTSLCAPVQGIAHIAVEVNSRIPYILAHNSPQNTDVAQRTLHQRKNSSVRMNLQFTNNDTIEQLFSGMSFDHLVWLVIEKR